jgi:hypothetical protein
MAWQTRWTTTALSTALVVALTGGFVAAHHSTAGLFNEHRSVAISGVLTGFRFVEPHATISIEIATPSGQYEVWRAETNGSGFLERSGWTKDSLRIGEAVTVEGFPAEGGLKRLRVNKLTRADGTVLLGLQSR